MDRQQSESGDDRLTVGDVLCNGTGYVVRDKYPLAGLLVIAPDNTILGRRTEYGTVRCPGCAACDPKVNADA